MIPVTKPYLPSRDKLNAYIDGIYDRCWLTNNGPLTQELTKRLEAYLGVENLLLVSNGTLALQIAYRALGLIQDSSKDTVEVVTTPFTFVATASSIKWEGMTPKFADIDPKTWCLDPEAIEPLVGPNTKAIVPVHVFGNACAVEEIETIANRCSLKVIYDAAHAFDVKYQGESVLKWGDAATLSFHATKIFHSIEGGAIVFKRKEDLERAKSLINFGITGPDTIGELGINAKFNEFQAAMGLCILDELETNLDARQHVWQRYYNELTSAIGDYLQFQTYQEATSNNAAYFPVVFNSEAELLKVLAGMQAEGVYLRRYFYPSLDTVPLLAGKQECANSRDIAKRVLCLPMYAMLLETDQNLVISRLIKIVKSLRTENET
jgi:dTDP-4-amino-4,6-dideoxygalactose transaminase